MCYIVGRKIPAVVIRREKKEEEQEEEERERESGEGEGGVRERY